MGTDTKTLDNLLDHLNRKDDEHADDIPTPGSDDNKWIAVERTVHGQKQLHILSGSERRRYNRTMKRAEAAEQQKGQRRYNRQLRRQEYDAQTVRMQMKILTGEIQASLDMQDNLTRHVMRQTRLNERAAGAEDRKARKAALAEARLFERRHARVDAGKGRHADLVALGLREG